jgi:signal transduction histidine kinase
MSADAAAVAPSGRRLLLARALLGVGLAGLLAGIVVATVDGGMSRQEVGDSLVFAVVFMTFPVVGYVVASRRPDNNVGWLMLGMGTYLGVSAVVGSYGPYAIHGGPGGRDLGLLLEAIDQPSWLPIVVPPATFLLLLFPDGHLPSPRWRWFARALGVALVLIFFAILLTPGPIEGGTLPRADNPLGIEALREPLGFALVLLVALPIGAIGSLASLVLRYRRAGGVERRQLRWLVSAAAFVAIFYSFVLVLSYNSDWEGSQAAGWQAALQSLVVFSFALIPIAIGVGILRHGLFDLDIVIKRAVLIGALAIFITLVYVAIVVGVGALVGSQANPVLSALAAAVVALAFQPARRRARKLADRLVYGKRATPYEVLSEFSERVGQTYASEELLPRMARALGEGTGSARSDVWVRVGDQLRSEARWPRDAESLPPRAASDMEGAVTPSSMFEPVRHQGELLGALSIEKRQGESLTATEEKLVRDLAAQAGLVMRNAGLTEELLDTIEQLRTSRQRLVTAQDEERRKLERNLHDGAQQQLVALTVKLRLLEQLTERDPAQARSMAAQLQGEAKELLEELRDLARGIYPPLLADAGLVAALESQARKSAVPVTIEGDGIGRYGRDAEAAIYFSCLEALQNVAKYAEATLATVTLSDGDGRLRFEVTDDGVGFDPDSSHGTGLQGIADRIAALGGELEVRSSRGTGTTVAGSLPVGRKGSSSEPLVDLELVDLEEV